MSDPIKPMSQQSLSERGWEFTESFTPTGAVTYNGYPFRIQVAKPNHTQGLFLQEHYKIRLEVDGPLEQYPQARVHVCRMWRMRSSRRVSGNNRVSYSTVEWRIWRPSSEPDAIKLGGTPEMGVRWPSTQFYSDPRDAVMPAVFTLERESEDSNVFTLAVRNEKYNVGAVEVQDLLAPRFTYKPGYKSYRCNCPNGKAGGGFPMLGAVKKSAGRRWGFVIIDEATGKKLSECTEVYMSASVSEGGNNPKMIAAIAPKR